MKGLISRQNIRATVKGFLLIAVVGILSACSQSRRSMYAGSKTEELWQPMSLCAVNIAGFNRMGCFSVQISIDRNLAYFDVQELLFNPASVPYRILARPAGQTAFQLLEDNVMVSAGGSIEVRARNGAYIEDYEEWRVELSKNKDASGMNYVPVPAASGLPVAQEILDWAELYEEEQY